jgi:hypothetical protein
METQLDYKTVIKARVKELGSRSANPITLKKLARHLQIQYTYLSRILNSEHEHLKEDLLYEALHFLEFSQNKIDYVMDLRVLTGSNSASRRSLAEKRVSQNREKFESDIVEKGALEAQLAAETAFMMDPYATIILASLSLKPYKKDPRLFLEPLGLDMEGLKQTLDRIEAAGFIERGEDWLEIKKVQQSRMHFRPDHPLMRLQQQQIKLLSQAKVQKLSDLRKKSVTVTFASDQKAFELIKKEFDVFIQKAQQLAGETTPKKTYQLIFDFFDWL